MVLERMGGNAGNLTMPGIFRVGKKKEILPN